MPDNDRDVEAIVAGAEHLLHRYHERAHILRAVLKGIDQFDAVRALIASSDSAPEAQRDMMALLDIDEVQARAVVSMQVLKLAKRERQMLADDCETLTAGIADLESTLASPERQRELAGTERGEYLAKQAESIARDNGDTR